MKKTLTTLLLALTAGVWMVNAQVVATADQEDNGHRLTALWKQYDQAQKADLPQKEADILAQIKSQALKQHLPEDFWDAATQYVWAVQRRDWKQTEQVKEGLREEVEQFAEPMVTFLWMEQWQYARAQQLRDYYLSQKDGFNGRHPAFYDNLYSFLGGALKEFIQNDAEYVLWHLYQSTYYNNPQDGAYFQDLKACISGRYPNQAALDYFLVSQQQDSDAKREALQELADRYPGQAAALFPRADLLRLQKRDLDQAGAPEADYRSLYARAQAFEKERKAYSGAEGRIARACTSVQELCETLTAQTLQVRSSREQIEVIFRNLSQADLELKQDKTVLKTWKVQNTAGSFYVPDTVRLAMPALPDGSYSLAAASGKIKTSTSYTQYTLSIAHRTDSRGRCVYVADYATGAPLRQVTLLLKKGDQEMASAVMKLDGFTPLPAAFEKAVAANKRAAYTLVAVDGERLSRTVSLQSLYTSSNPDISVKCNIYKDRGAYNPGDTLQFKAVLYQGDPSQKLSVCKSRKVEVILRDAQDKVLETRILTTNAYGSVSGSFVLPKGLRNGYFSLEVKGLARDSFRVDEFVLPTFAMHFDQRDSLYLAGDSVPVSGRLESYSGHNLTGATVRVVANRYGTSVLDEQQPLEAGNTFHFRIPARESGYYRVEINVTDATGETLQGFDNFYVGDALSVRADIEDAQDADLTLSAALEPPIVWRRTSPRFVVRGTQIRFTPQALDAAGGKVPLAVSFQLLKDGKTLAEGRGASGETVTVNALRSGLYTLKATVSAPRADGKEIKGEQESRILVLTPGEPSLTDAGVRRVFLAGPTSVDSRIEAVLGSVEADAYALVTVYGKDRKVLENRQVPVQKGQLAALDFDYKEAWPDAVRLQVFYFIKGEAVTFQRQYRRARTHLNLPLEITRFADKAIPGTRCTVTLKTEPGVEALAAAWDKSLDAVARNVWPEVTLRDVSVENVFVSASCGAVTELTDYTAPVFYSIEKRNVKSVATAAAFNTAVVLEDDVALEEAATAEGAAGEEEAVPVRSIFATALTFQPHLQPAADGTLSFSFCASDKLSTYYVRVYAHDATLRNATAERELLVTIPVKVSLQEPRFLYEGDCYEAAVTVSSTAEDPVSGTLVLNYNGVEQQLPVTVPAGATATRSFTLPAAAAGDLTLTATFRSPDFSDAVRVTVPVYPAVQTLTEAHSAVLRDGQDREALLDNLGSRFVNVPASAATLQETSLLEMVQAAMPSHKDPAADDILSLTEAWYVRLRASIPGADDLLERILACRNADGGFGWFEGMRSSPILTAVVLERAAKLRDLGFAVPDLSAAAQWLDQVQLEEDRPFWYGGLSMAQYLHVRALYASVPLEGKVTKEFKKAVKAYLTPAKKDGRGLEGRILEKARRVQTLRNLLNRPGGAALAKAWGASLTSCRLKKSLKADTASLLEYAVEHRDGGWYYPNAVLPWRGLLESEAYAHSLLCDLLSDTEGGAAIADGIRLWLMLQKESQQWEASPAFVDAIHAILNGSQAVLNTRILALSATYTLPFAQIQAAGNGFTVERTFLRNNQPLAPGDPVSLGDKITIQYQIWNAENRSFVRLTAGREAALRPVQQLSGPMGGTFLRPAAGGLVWGFTPQGYRNVKAASTEFYFDVFPEEKTTLTEAFFVTEAGTFQAPVTVIESLYAPHYRANSAFQKKLLSLGR